MKSNWLHTYAVTYLAQCVRCLTTPQCHNVQNPQSRFNVNGDEDTAGHWFSEHKVLEAFSMLSSHLIIQNEGWVTQPRNFFKLNDANRTLLLTFFKSFKDLKKTDWAHKRLRIPSKRRPTSAEQVLLGPSLPTTNLLRARTDLPFGSSSDFGSGRYTMLQCVSWSSIASSVWPYRTCARMPHGNHSTRINGQINK